MFALENVNALAQNQEIAFGQQLSIIYGGNGSGKTGYARILACSASSKGQRNIQTNVYSDKNDIIKPKASIEISDGKDHHVIEYEYVQGRRCVELSNFHVFDMDSLSVYLDQNEIEIIPAGLGYLTKLAIVTDKVRDLVRNKIDTIQENHDFERFFEGESSVVEIIRSITAETDIVSLKKLTILTICERKEIKTHIDEISRLNQLRIPDKIELLKLELASLNQLVESILFISNNIGKEAITEIHGMLDNYSLIKSEASRLSIEQFKFNGFTHIGTDQWHKFIKAAKSLAAYEKGPENIYPQTGDVCLLCRQTLAQTEVDLLQELWKYIESNANVQLATADGSFTDKYSEIEKIYLDIFSEDTPAKRLIEKRFPEDTIKIISFLEDCERRRVELLSMLGTKEKKELTVLDIYSVDNLRQLISEIQNEIEELSLPENEQMRISKECALRVYTHRFVLSKHIENIEKHIKLLKWKNKATASLGNTSHITRKHGEFMAEIMENKYKKIFNEILKSFGLNLKVNINTIGEKSKRLKRICLKDATRDTKLGHILSEGEKSAIALSDFFTEILINTESSGIILDDPVTSLDAEWKRKFAEFLARASICKQVIIFTHDLRFMSFLVESAEKFGAKVATSWIKRGSPDDIPGYVTNSSGPGLEAMYKSAEPARECLKKANNETDPRDQAIFIESGYSRLRACYESLIVNELFNDVVHRCEDQLRINNLKKIAWNDDFATEIVEKHGSLSRATEAHSHSDGFKESIPDIKSLSVAIEEYENLKQRIKDEKKKKRVK